MIFFYLFQVICSLTFKILIILSSTADTSFLL